MRRAFGAPRAASIIITCRADQADHSTRRSGCVVAADRVADAFFAGDAFDAARLAGARFADAFLAGVFFAAVVVLARRVARAAFGAVGSASPASPYSERAISADSCSPRLARTFQ